MVIAAVVEAVIGIDAEGEQLEDIAKPLTAEAAEGGEASEPSRDGDGRPADLVQRGNRFSRPAWSPTAVASSRPRMDRDLDRELAAIVSALSAAATPLDRRELASRVAARRWGAGRFSIALSIAAERGLVRRVGRGSYEALRTAEPAGRS
jgi:hypothetical protein